MVNYRGFRLKKINEPEYRHLWLLSFWAVFGLWFFLAEWVFPTNYHVVSCRLDAAIPFCEWFVIPYVLWFGFVAAPVLLLLLTDIPAFRRLMHHIIITYSMITVIYVLYPTCQNLRPVVFPRDNFLTRMVQFLYQVDTPTNVCPSLHVVGSMVAARGLIEVKQLRRWGGGIYALALLISISTVLIKQHSLVDVVLALVLYGATYPMVYCRRKREKL